MIALVASVAPSDSIKWNANGNHVAPIGVVFGGEYPDLYPELSLTPDCSGGAVLVYVLEEKTDDGHDDIYAQRVDALGAGKLLDDLQQRGPGLPGGSCMKWSTGACRTSRGVRAQSLRAHQRQTCFRYFSR